MDFSPSHCRKHPFLHKYVTVQENAGDVLERCVRCGKRNAIKTHNGQVDIVRYSKQHMREFLIPQHRLFAREYKRV